MKIAYFDCFAGAGGDMILGSLLDAGLSVQGLKHEVAKLGLSHYDIEVQKVTKRGVGGSQAIVQIHGDYHQPLRHLREVEGLIGESDLDDLVKEWSIKVFRRLAAAEATVHRTTVDRIHFHEVGAMDAIIDVVGSIAGMASLGIEQVFCSPLHLGSGTVKCAHGLLPVPAPATAELIKGKPVYSTGVEGELLTPTAAAILTTISSSFGPMPAMKIDAIGYGAGVSDPPIPNLLRISVGDREDRVQHLVAERVAVVETNIDDMNPQIYDYLIEKMLAMGALDVFLVPAHMKKNRPATILSVICPPRLLGSIAEFIMRETTSIGLRWRMDDRLKTERHIQEVQTRFGPIRFKVALLGNETVNAVPEYDDCTRVAKEKKIPLKKVMEEARRCIAQAGLLHKTPEASSGRTGSSGEKTPAETEAFFSAPSP